MAAVGEAFLSAAFQVAIELLISRTLREFGEKFGIGRDLKKLSRTLSKIQAVLNDAEAKQMDNELIKLWLSELKEVHYDAEDLIDEVATQAALFNQNKKVTNWLSKYSKEVFFKLGLASKIKEIDERLEEIAKERDELGLREGVKATWSEKRDVDKSQTSSLLDESRVFGRKEDTKEVVKLLVCEENCGKDVFDVVPIIGMGGLGKTTLAQLVYNDVKVIKHFELRMWICVSDDFNVQKLTKSIIESVDKKHCDPLDLDILQTKLRDLLKGKKFLLVLDDVWNEKKNEWDKLYIPFKVGAPGSKIIVTSRSEKVASIMGTISPYRLEGLSESDCWSLFKQRAFVDGNAEDAYPNLVSIGKKILKKCQGLPLAAKTLGGLLCGKTEDYEWNMILESDMLDLEPDENEILPALRLSYNHLPAHLKQCFVYCSIFPKDYNFEKEDLILLWMAEGFVHPKRTRCLEDVASDYFEDLLLRSFFQKYKTDSPSKFVMHDLIHDLALHVAGETCFSLADEKSEDISEKVRHSSLIVNSSKSITFEAFKEAKGLRTMLLLGNKYSHEIPNVAIPEDLIPSLRRLRSWNLSYIGIKELPDQIGDLRHIRFLDLSHTHISKLPDSTCSLYNLQTLILVDCNKLRDLPKDTKYLVNLHHLNVSGCWHLASMPPQLGKLSSLQRLHRFVAGKETGCGISELKEMNELRATLCIDRIEEVVDVKEAKEANLKKKQYIHSLVLKWSRSRSVSDGIDGELLECLEPHANLKELKIEVYPGAKFPKWMGNSALSHLEKIEFFLCNYCQILPPLGQLPFLKELTIYMMSELQSIGREFYGEGKIKGFPSLEKLKLEDMRSLNGWEEIDNGEFPVLREVTILKCRNICNLPKFPSVRELTLDDCDETILHSVRFLSTLSLLKISNFQRVKSLPGGLLQSLNALEELKIQHFYRLRELEDEVGLQDVPSLRCLEILCCPKLLSFPGQGMPSKLQNLSIGVCSDLKDLPSGIQNLSSLQELDISRCPKLVSFPKEKLPSSLKNLRISACPTLELLPTCLHELSNLEALTIESCQKIASLPDSVLPASLRQLSINECTVLEERCQEGGEDWHKIAHVPNKWIKF